MKINGITDIRSIGWLNCHDGSVNLGVCLKSGSHQPYFVNISKVEFNKIRGNEELMKQKAVDEMSKSDYVSVKP